MRKSDAGAAAALIAKGLSPRLRPARDSEYEELLARHRTDADFRELVAEIAHGLGLAVLDAGPTGILLGPEDGSVYSLRLADYRANMPVKDRLVHGLVHLGIASWCYPTDASLLADDVRRVTVNGVERFLRGAVERLRETHGAEDPDADQPESERAWRLYLRMPAARETGDGRAAARTTTRMIAYAMERLADHGLFEKESSAEGGTYRALSRYRVQVRELAATEAWRLLAAARREQEDRCST